jgi:aminocarboxymuconate-semialdehyde decarboxylase
VIVSELLRDAGSRESWRPNIYRDGGRQVVELEGVRVSSAVREFVELDDILATLERAEIQAVLLSPWVPLLYYGADPRDGLARCRLQNSGLARLREHNPGRVSVLGAVPLQDPHLAAHELEQLMATRAFAGVEVTTSVNGDYLGDPRFEPFWSAAEEHDALVFVHPTTRGLPIETLDHHYLWNLVGNPIETTIAAAHLVLAGTMGRHPHLRVLLAHGGGAIVALGGRLGHGQQTVAAAGPAPGDPAHAAQTLIRRFLFDTITHDPQQLRALVDAVGADRVLLGSDYPFDMADPDPVATVRAAGLGECAEHALLSGNAARELKLGLEARS